MKENFLITGDEYNKIAQKLRNECIEYLTRVCKEHGRIEFDEDNDDEYICIAYDGGNHPEYASNICSQCYAVKLNERGNISVEIEETDDYEHNRIETIEIYDIAFVVYNKLND